MNRSQEDASRVTSKDEPVCALRNDLKVHFENVRECVKNWPDWEKSLSDLPKSWSSCMPVRTIVTHLKTESLVKILNDWVSYQENGCLIQECFLRDLIDILWGNSLNFYERATTVYIIALTEYSFRAAVGSASNGISGGVKCGSESQNNRFD